MCAVKAANFQQLTFFLSCFLNDRWRTRWWLFQRRVCIKEISQEGEIKFGGAADNVLRLYEYSTVELLSVLQHHLGTLDQVDGIEDCLE